MTNDRTGFLEIKAAEEYIVRWLAEKESEDVCVMFLIDIACPAASGKELQVQKRLKNFSGILSSLFRATDIIGYDGRDRFLVFIAGGITEEAAYEKARTICGRLQFGMDEDGIHSTEVYVGAYTAHRNGLPYEELYGRAEAALLKAKGKGKGSYCVESDAEDTQRKYGKIRYPESMIPLHTLISGMTCSVCLLEQKEAIRLVYANEAFCRMAGWKPEERRLPCLLEEAGIQPEDREGYRQTLCGVISTYGTGTHIHRFWNPDRGWIWIRAALIRLERPGGAYPVVLELSEDISEFMENRRLLRENVERLRVAAGQTPHMLWEVDIGQRVCSVYDVNTQTSESASELENFPEGLLVNGIIHPDSAANFREFAENMLRGHDAGSGNFIMKEGPGGCYAWVALSYRMVYGDDGRPVKAVGVQRRLPDISGVYASAFPRRSLPEMLRHRLLARIQVNLTDDVIEKVWMNGADQTEWASGRTYTDVMENGEARLFEGNTGAGFQKRFSRKNLLELFEKKELWSTREHRRIDNGGRIRWMADLVNLQYDEQTKDVYMLACFCDEQQRHEWEQLAGIEDTRREEDGLYTAEAAKKIAEYLIAEKKGTGTYCAMAVIRLEGNLKKIVADAHMKEESLREFVASVLSFTLGTDGIAAWRDETSIQVFFPDAGTRSDIRRRIEDAYVYIRESMPVLSGETSSRFVGGVVHEPLQNANYENLLSRAAYLCEFYRNAATDTVGFSDGKEEESWRNLQKAADTAVPVANITENRNLSGEEQELILRCVTSMLSSASLEASVENALSVMGEYYRADRVYILSLSDNGQEVTMRYEWIRNGKYSIRNVMSGIQISRMPLLLRCLEKQIPLITESRKAESAGSGAEEIWHFLVYPLKEENSLRGFFCVENAQKHMEDTALLNVLIPYLDGERGRFRRYGEGQGEHQDVLSHVPNLQYYMDIIYSLGSDRYNSMGAVAVDIPDFSRINSRQGFEYGREILKYCADILSGIFGRSYLFRTWDAEFVVLYPNTIQQVFNSRCVRLRSILDRRYPGVIRIGHTWSDGVFAARDLVHEARYIMSCDQTKKEDGQDRHPALAEAAHETPMEDNYVIYLQPKIDMRDGSLAGAEVLVRGLDHKGGIILPSQFIDGMEEDGTIRELDFFVLEKTLQLLSRWKERGAAEVPVSINISRRTLLASTTLASILAIQSRYPEIPLSQVRFEITETATSVETATLTEVIRKFEEFGIRFELDDFGSRYASMAIFSTARFHTVKLDRSLINGLAGNEINLAFVESIAGICRKFGMECIAEGVETKQQQDALLGAGCVLGQGYYYSRAVSAEQFEEKYLSSPAGNRDTDIRRV